MAISARPVIRPRQKHFATALLPLLERSRIVQPSDPPATAGRIKFFSAACGAVITAPQIGASCLGSVWDRRVYLSSPAGRVCAPPQRRSLPLASLSKDREAVTRRA